MSQTNANVTLRGTPSLERARRWRSRIDVLVGKGAVDVPDHVRVDIEDCVAAALGEGTEVFEKAKLQLEDVYVDKGESRTKAEDRARGFVREWLVERPFIRGMLAVRHLDVHFEARSAGRTIQIQPPRSKPYVKVWWTHPAIPEDEHQKLRPTSRLSDQELADFNHLLKDTDRLEVIDRTLSEVSEFHSALAKELG